MPGAEKTAAQLDDSALRALRRRLRSWFRKNARKLPWRGTRDPYLVWVSEIMLQQTQVETVKPYYRRFIERFPDVAALAAAPELDVLRLWEGLGYYRRARQLHRAAREIVRDHGGQFPREVEAVRRLPGIGRYTAGAVLSIACDQRLPIVEANTIRLYARLLAFRGDPWGATGQRTLWQFAERILPREKAGEFNQALMELGSQICTPREPRCDACPLADLCPTRAADLQGQIPRPKKKPVFESLREVAVIVSQSGKVLLRRCGPDERWAGLWDFPRFAQSDDPARLAEHVQTMSGIRIGPTRHIATLRHGVTRFRITLDCLAAKSIGGRLHRGRAVRWVRTAELDTYPLSTTGRNICRLLAAGIVDSSPTMRYNANGDRL